MNNFLDNKQFRMIKKHMDIVVAAMVLMIIGLIIIPLPSILLDIFLALNIGIGVLVLLLSIFSRNVLDFSVFPTLLLVTTLFRLSLNVSSTRLILSNGDAGSIVEAFGSFVTQGDMVVGAVIFIIICIVQFMVITNGSTRVAEVSARFALDAMPGKQMSIDADLNAGIIDEAQAKIRREKIQIEAEFYGAMDGASKFVKGDAIAGIIIVLINFIGGIIIFSLKGFEVMDAIEKFGILTIGDGLVSQVPALLISVSAGIIVTRTPSEENIGTDLSKQLMSVPKAVAMASVVLFVFGLVPGLPTIPFFAMGILVGLIAYVLFEGEKTESYEVVSVVDEGENPEAMKPNDDMTSYLNIETFEIEFGYGLLPLVDGAKGENVLERILKLRKQIVQELGVIVPSIRLKDNVSLPDHKYVIRIKGNVIGEGEIYPQQYLMINPIGVDDELDGIDTIEPTFGLQAKWIDERLKSKAENLGYTTVDDVTVLITNVKEIIKTHSHELLGRQELKTMLDVIKETQPSVVEDLIPDILPLGEVLKVLKGLLRENISIRDLGTILEALADYGTNVKDHELLIEYVRHVLGRKVVAPFLNEQGILEVIQVDSRIEDIIGGNIQRSFQGSFPSINPDMGTQIFHSLQMSLDSALKAQRSPVVLVNPRIRPAFKRMIEISFPTLAVLSLNDIPNHIQFEVVGKVSI